jgi:hypothetical protein
MKLSLKKIAEVPASSSSVLLNHDLKNYQTNLYSEIEYKQEKSAFILEICTGIFKIACRVILGTSDHVFIMLK